MLADFRDRGTNAEMDGRRRLGRVPYCPMRFIRAGAFALGVCVLAGPRILADDWPQARPITIFTAAADRFLRILPGRSVGDLVGFSGSPKGPYASAEMYVRQPDRSYRFTGAATLVNPVAPVNALLAPGGAFITFDNWHNLGYGKVVAIYRADGTPVRTYTLEDLYRTRDLSSVPTSVSSRAWRCAPFFFVTPEGLEAYTGEFLGGEFVFNMKDGSFRYSPGKVKDCVSPMPQWER